MSRFQARTALCLAVLGGLVSCELNPQPSLPASGMDSASSGNASGVGGQQGAGDPVVGAAGSHSNSAGTGPIALPNNGGTGATSSEAAGAGGQGDAGEAGQAGMGGAGAAPVVAK